jgi:hypothetical protein
VSAGNPTGDELAALTAVLHRHREQQRQADDGRESTPTSRWIRAARLEGRGHPPIDAPDRMGRVRG